MAGHAFDHLTLDERRARLDAQAAVLANQQAARRFALQIAPTDRAAAERLPREERLRSTAACAGAPSCPCPLGAAGAAAATSCGSCPSRSSMREDLRDAVVILVGRDGSGLAEIRASRSSAASLRRRP